jgi:hypothetical protein
VGTSALAVLFAVVALASLMAPTSAAPEPDSIHIRMFAHGKVPAGEAQIHEAVSGSYMTMDREAPTADVPKSIAFINAGAASPEPRCAGSPYFPVWVGEVGGHIKGKVVFEFYVVSSPGGKARVRVWPDMSTFGCEEDYREPLATTVVELPTGSGKVSAVMNDVDFEAATNVMVQVNPSVPGASQARLLYDARSAPTSLTFDCTPLWGKTCEAYED